MWNSATRRVSEPIRFADCSRGVIVARILSFSGSAFTILLALHLCLTALTAHTFFDDSMMFYRYAIHMHQSHVIAWNPGGPPVFGVTSIPWLLLVWGGRFFIADPSRLLVSLSCATGLLAFLLASVIISRNSRSGLLSRASYVFPILGIPLLLNVHFSLSFANGMETMLGLLANVLFVACVLRFARLPDTPISFLLAAAGAFAVLTRPETVVCVILTPVLAWYLLVPRSRPRLPIFLYSGSLALLLGADLLFNVLYFRSALPLSFYIKAVHGYEGYALYLNPFAYTTLFFGMSLFPLLAIVSFAQRRDLPMLAVFGIPLGLTLLYFLTVVQIMGLGARYYVPFLPFVFLPAAHVIDAAMRDRSRGCLSGVRLVGIAITLIVSVDQFSDHISGPLGTIVASRKLVYASPTFVTEADVRLAYLGNWWNMCLPVARIAKRLPPGSTIAASEVGLLGALAPETTVLDMAGLNDPQIARNGFSMDYVLAAKPALIWLPHSDYTRIYGIFSSDPRLLERYVLYAGAFDFGLAVRRDLPPDSPVVLAVKQVWAETYPGVEINRYVVQRVMWNPAPASREMRSVIAAHP